MSKRKQKLYYVSVRNGYCGIEAAETEAEARRSAAYEWGGANIKDVHEATEDEISWTNAMGGRVPEVTE